MGEPQDNFGNQKIKIIAQTQELSRLLGIMIPSDETISLQEPLTQNKMALSDWSARPGIHFSNCPC